MHSAQEGFFSLSFVQHILRYFRLGGSAHYGDGHNGTRVIVAKERAQRLE
jgi:hypothetical protein